MSQCGLIYVLVIFNETKHLYAGLMANWVTSFSRQVLLIFYLLIFCLIDLCEFNIRS